MASVQNFVQNSQTRTVQHNHVVIKYQQPPDPAIVNHVLEILVATTRGYAQKNLVQIPYIQDYIDQIVPFLQILYSEKCTAGLATRSTSSSFQYHLLTTCLQRSTATPQ